MAWTRPLPPRPTPATPDVVVAGSGLIGLAIAFEAASRGLRVVLLDPDRPGTASLAAAGLIAPSLGILPPPIQKSFDEARELFEPFVRRVSEISGEPVDVRWGLLEVAVDAEEWREMSARESPSADCLVGSELAKVEPALAGAEGGLLHSRDGWTDPGSLVAALRAAVRGSPRIQRRPERLVEITFERAGVALGLESGATLRAPRIVVAAGAWTAEIRGLPELPVAPVKGQLISIGSLPLHHAVAGTPGYIVPRDGHIVVGSTVEHVGFNWEPTAEGREMLLEAAKRLLPGVHTIGAVERAWGGLRPMTPDRLPLLGPLADYPQVIVAAGHGKNGVLFAPFTALAVTSELLSETAKQSLSPFAPTRFDHWLR